MHPLISIKNSSRIRCAAASSTSNSAAMRLASASKDMVFGLDVATAVLKGWRGWASQVVACSMRFAEGENAVEEKGEELPLCRKAGESVTKNWRT